MRVLVEAPTLDLVMSMHLRLVRSFNTSSQPVRRRRIEKQRSLRVWLFG